MLRPVGAQRPTSLADVARSFLARARGAAAASNQETQEPSHQTRPVFGGPYRIRVSIMETLEAGLHDGDPFELKDVGLDG